LAIWPQKRQVNASTSASLLGQGNVDAFGQARGLQLQRGDHLDQGKEVFWLAVQNGGKKVKSLSKMINIV
jgi:hypothetical protein